MYNFKSNFFAVCICMCVGLTAALNLPSIVLEFSTNTIAKRLISASITGATTVCINEPEQPQITFTGTDGLLPYQFTYTVNGGAAQVISTSGTNSSISISVNTTIAGSFEYELLSVTDGNNETETINETATITVASPPTISFTFVDGGCSGVPIDFTPNVQGNGPFTYTWNFGDGSTSTQENPSHRFDAFGCGFSNYTTVLEVTDTNGCSTTVSEVVNVEQRPDLLFDDLIEPFLPFDNCGNNTVDPTYTIEVGNSSPSVSCITSYDVDWGDGSSETNISFPITHTYTVLGSFNMTFTGYGDSGCNATKTILVKNSSNPAGNVTNPGNTTNLCLPVEDLGFTIADWGGNPQDTTYFVDFGDGTQGNFTQADLVLATPSYDPLDDSTWTPFPLDHIYDESSCPGDGYIITLIISTSCGSTISTAGPITLLKLPDVDFEYESPGCVNSQIQFLNLTEGGFGPNCSDQAQHVWDFGDGTTSNQENPVHVYAEPGNYTVTLREENFCGITDPVIKTICIEPELVVDFALDNFDGCVPLNVTAANTTDLSQSCGSDTYLWEIVYTPEFCDTSESWSFTGGTDETSENPSFQFNNAGIYEISMTITNSCGDYTTQKTVEVKRPPAVSIDAIDDGCGMVSFNPSVLVETCASTSDTVSYSWSFPGGTPATSDELNPGTITYSTVGDYTVTFSVTNNCGTTTVTEDVSINEIPSITNTNISQSLCSGASTVAIDLNSNIANTAFTWTSNNPPELTGFIPSGTSNSIPSQTLINLSGVPITLIYTVIPEFEACIGEPVNFEITVEPAPIITTQPISESVCLDGTANDLTVAFQGTGNATYQWYENTVDDTNTGTPIAGETNMIFTPPTNTVGVMYYYVVITFTSGGCNEITSDTAEIIVANTTQIDTDPLSTQSICVGGTSAELLVEISGGAGASYQWYSNTINTSTGGTLIAGATGSSYTPPIFTNAGAFYYYVEISFVATGCASLTSSPAEVVVVEDPVVTTQPLVFQSICENAVVEDLEVAVTGGLGNVSYQWYFNSVNDTTTGTVISGATNFTFTPPSNGVGTSYYYCTITQDVSGCEITSETAAVEVNAGAQFTSQPLSETLCLGETTNALTVSYTNGTGAPSYQWYQNTINGTTSGTPIEGAISDTYAPLVDTVGIMYYYVIITFGSGGCTEIISNVAEIIVNDTPSISDADVLICSGNVFEYLPETNSSNTVPLETTYTWPTPSVVPSGSIVGATAQLSPSANISQLLENTTVNPATVTYTITPITGNCQGNPFEVVVTVNPSISVTPTIINNFCFQSNNASIAIDITGGVPFSIGDSYNISWTGPNGFTSTDEDIFDLEAGSYSLEILDDGGCPYSETFTITEPEELTFSFVDFDPETISCFGASDGNISIDVAGGTETYTYTWTLDGLFFSNDEDLINLGPGEYAISVTDTNNCGPITRNFIIEEPEVLDVTLDTKVDILCFGDATGAITVNVMGGRLDYLFNWTGPNNFVSENQNLDTLFAGIYNLTVTDNSGCSETLEVEIIQSDQINIDVTVTEIVCFGDNNASITIESIFGGIPPYEISWSNFGTGNVQSNLSAGTYTITVTDDENCTRDFPIIIDEAPIFRIDPVVTQMSCSGENDASIVLNFEGGIDPVTVVWDDDINAGIVRNNLLPGIYNVIITDGTPCVIEESFTIFDIEPLLLSANVTNALDCNDTNSGGINLLIEGGTPPFSTSWSNGVTTEDLVNVPPNNYTVLVTDANGCEIQGSWEVSRFEPLVLEVETQSVVDCDTNTVNQTFEAMASGGVPPFDYVWSNGVVSGLNSEFMSTDEDGLVVLEVTDSQGCTANYTFNVDMPVLGNPDFDLSSYGFANFGVYAIEDPIIFNNLSTGDVQSILWDFGDGNFSSEESPTHIYSNAGTYAVTQTVTYPFGCVYERIISLTIEKGYKLVMPDAFTPNEDGINDFFRPVFIGLNSLELNIYDTWGSLVYSEDDDNFTGWNGKIKDETAENGNYYYTFRAKTFYGKEITAEGAFVFIK